MIFDLEVKSVNLKEFDITEWIKEQKTAEFPKLCATVEHFSLAFPNFIHVGIWV